MTVYQTTNRRESAVLSLVSWREGLSLPSCCYPAASPSTTDPARCLACESEAGRSEGQEATFAIMLQHRVTDEESGCPGEGARCRKNTLPFLKLQADGKLSLRRRAGRLKDHCQVKRRLVQICFLTILSVTVRANEKAKGGYSLPPRGTAVLHHTIPPAQERHQQALCNHTNANSKSHYGCLLRKQPFNYRRG